MIHRYGEAAVVRNMKHACSSFVPENASSLCKVYSDSITSLQHVFAEQSLRGEGHTCTGEGHLSCVFCACVLCVGVGGCGCHCVCGWCVLQAVSTGSS